MKPEHLGISAIVIAVLGGGSGVGLNYSSNAAVLKNIEEIKIAVVKIEDGLKENNDGRARIEKVLDHTANQVEKLKNEQSELLRRISLLEAKVK